MGKRTHPRPRPPVCVEVAPLARETHHQEVAQEQRLVERRPARASEMVSMGEHVDGIVGTEAHSLH
jgi:hypothetical protein